MSLFTLIFPSGLMCSGLEQRSYVDLLGKFGDDLEDPFNKFIQYKDQTTKQLEDICGHYVESESSISCPHHICFRTSKAGSRLAD